MLLRIIFPLIILFTLPDWYCCRVWLPQRCRMSAGRALLWCLPDATLFVFLLYIVLQGGFAPKDVGQLNCFLFLFGLLCVPKALFSVFSFVGFLLGKRWQRAWICLDVAGLIAALFSLFVLFWGVFVGWREFEVRRVTFQSAALPQEFDGYRILHFSDLHVGSYLRDEALLTSIVERMNREKPDIMLFTGDLQNRSPEEIATLCPILSRLRARDGVFSVMGNHDYAMYITKDTLQQRILEQRTVALERLLGWHLLRNDNRRIWRNGQSIVIAGMENHGKPPFPALGNVEKTMQGVTKGDFTVLLEHDPSAFRRLILPKRTAQLTLSGHTHNMQFSLFGWSPCSLLYSESAGYYAFGQRAINVSQGIGGFIPFRFGAVSECTVITLKRKK